MITVIVETITSERDINGNCYHFATFYNTAKTRAEHVTMEVGSQSNARGIAYEIARDFENMLAFESTVPKREFQRMRKNAGVELYEGGQEAKDAIAALFAPIDHKKAFMDFHRQRQAEEVAIETGNATEGE